jgi:multidrug resistance efflux pump
LYQSAQLFHLSRPLPAALNRLYQRLVDQRSAQAAVETAKAAITDAQLDLEFSRITAPFTGRIGAHLASGGGLVRPGRRRLSTAPVIELTYRNYDSKYHA